MSWTECDYYDNGHCELHGTDCEDHLWCYGVEKEATEELEIECNYPMEK